MESPFDPTQAQELKLERLTRHCDDGLEILRYDSTHIDGTSIRELFEVVASLTNKTHSIAILDLTGIEFVSSGMMSVLIISHKRLVGAGGRFLVVIPSMHVMNTFRVMNLHLILKLHPDLPSAKAAAKGPDKGSRTGGVSEPPSTGF
jgi:anti-anti-sigma factor